jgi:hypothetical protein
MVMVKKIKCKVENVCRFHRFKHDMSKGSLPIAQQKQSFMVLKFLIKCELKEMLDLYERWLMKLMP